MIREWLIWVVVKIMVPFWITIIIRHQICRVPKGDHNFDNHLYERILQNASFLRTLQVTGASQPKVQEIVRLGCC